MPKDHWLPTRQRAAIRRRVREPTLKESRKYQVSLSIFCPGCGAPMRLITMPFGKRVQFWGCTTYPQCRKTRRFSPEDLKAGEYVEALDETSELDAEYRRIVTGRMPETSVLGQRIVDPGSGDLASCPF